MVASGEILGISDRRAGAPWTLGEGGGWVALDEMDVYRRWWEAEPYNLEVSEVGGLHLLEPKYLLVEIGEAPNVRGLSRDMI